MVSELLISLFFAFFSNNLQEPESKFFNFSPSKQAIELAENVKQNYKKTFGGKSNLLTQVINKNEIESWYIALDKVRDYVDQNNKELNHNLDILNKTSDYIFKKIFDIYISEIVQHIIKESDKENGLAEINMVNLSYKELDLVSIESRLKHGKKIYVSMLQDLKKIVNKYNGKNKIDLKYVILTTINCIENGFDKMQFGLVELKKFVNYQVTLTGFNPDTLKLAYKLIGYKVSANGLSSTSSPSEIFNLKDWEKDNFEHLKMKYQNLLNSFKYLKDNPDVNEQLYDAIKIILDSAFESLVDNFS